MLQELGCTFHIQNGCLGKRGTRRADRAMTIGGELNIIKGILFLLFFFLLP